MPADEQHAEPLLRGEADGRFHAARSALQVVVDLPHQAHEAQDAIGRAAKRGHRPARLHAPRHAVYDGPGDWLRDARQPKNLSIVIRATPSISRWPTRAMRPPTSAVAVTSTSVPDVAARNAICALPRANPGLPVASTMSR